MTLGRADHQGDLFDEAARFCEESLPENSIYGFLAPPTTKPAPAAATSASPRDPSARSGTATGAVTASRTTSRTASASSERINVTVMTLQPQISGHDRRLRRNGARGRVWSQPSAAMVPTTGGGAGTATNQGHTNWWCSMFRGIARRDRDTNIQVTATGWLVVRIWGHEDPAEAAQAIDDSRARPNRAEKQPFRSRAPRGPACPMRLDPRVRDQRIQIKHEQEFCENLLVRDLIWCPRGELRTSHTPRSGLTGRTRQSPGAIVSAAF